MTSETWKESEARLGLEGSACAPVYRDILIFKHDQKITIIAKPCFECYQKVIVGSTNKKCEQFDFGTLWEILRTRE